jgi:hypothetical protein
MASSFLRVLQATRTSSSLSRMQPLAASMRFFATKPTSSAPEGQEEKKDSEVCGDGLSTCNNQGDAKRRASDCKVWLLLF